MTFTIWKEIMLNNGRTKLSICSVLASTKPVIIAAIIIRNRAFSTYNRPVKKTSMDKYVFVFIE